MTAMCEAWNSELMIVAYQFLFSRRFFTLQEKLGRHFHHSCETLMFSLPKNPVRAPLVLSSRQQKKYL